MTEPKTKPTEVVADDFIGAVEPPAKRVEAEVLDALFRRASGVEPKMWGPSIIGYGSYRYRYASGHEGRAARIGFSPRKAKHSIYLLGCGGGGANGQIEALLSKLGKYSRGAACLYVNKVADIDLTVLEEMAALSWMQSFVDWPED